MSGFTIACVNRKVGSFFTSRLKAAGHHDALTLMDALTVT